MIELTLCLLVVVGAAALELPRASDRVEVGGLARDQLDNFSIFCLETRDLVHEYLASRNQLHSATIILNTLFHSAEQLGREPYTLRRASAGLLAGKIRDPDNKLADLGPIAEEKLAYLALFGVIDRTKNEATRQTLNKLDKHRELVGPTNLLKHLKEACKAVNDLEFALSRALDDYLTKVRAKLDEGLSSLRCATSQKVVHLNGICRFALLAPTVQSGELTYAPVGAL